MLAIIKVWEFKKQLNLQQVIMLEFIIIQQSQLQLYLEHPYHLFIHIKRLTTTKNFLAKVENFVREL